MAPWNAQLNPLYVHPNSIFVGKSIKQSHLRNVYGVNIVAIQRGARVIATPSPDEIIFPGDEILCLATEVGLEKIRKLIEKPDDDLLDIPGQLDSYELRQIEIQKNHFLVGKTVAESKIREDFGGIIVGIERDHYKRANPEFNFEIHAGDILLIAGQTEKLRALAKEWAPAPLTPEDASPKEKSPPKPNESPS